MLGSLIFYSGNQYTFQWTAQEHAAMYRFSLLSPDDGVVSSRLLNATQYTTAIPVGKSYNWRVEALDASGQVLSSSSSNSNGDTIYFSPGKIKQDDYQVIASSSAYLIMELGNYFHDSNESWSSIHVGYVTMPGKEKNAVTTFLQGNKISSGAYAISDRFLLYSQTGELYEKQGNTYVLRAIVGENGGSGGLVDAQPGKFWIDRSAYAYSNGKVEALFELPESIRYWDGKLAVTSNAVYRIEDGIPRQSATVNFNVDFSDQITASSQFVVGFEYNWETLQAQLKSYQINPDGTVAKLPSVDFFLSANQTLKLDILQLYGNRLLVDVDVSQYDEESEYYSSKASSSTRMIRVYEFQNGSWAQIYTASRTGDEDSYYWKDASTLVRCVENGIISTIKLPAAPPVAGEVPNTPENLISKISKYTMTLKWDKVPISGKGAKVSYEIMIDGERFISKQNSFSIKSMAPGNYSYQIRAIDSLSGSSDWSSEYSVDVIDVTAPKLGKVTAAINGYSGMVNWSGTDNVGIEKYVVNCAGQSQTVTAETTAKFDNLAVGKYKATVQGFDAAGNASKVGSVSITVKDVTPPEQVNGLVAPFADTNYNALLQWAPGVDNSGKVSYYQIRLDNGKLLKSTKNSLKVSKLSVGDHAYQVRAVDKDKNIGEWSAAQTFTVKDVTAPFAVSVKAKVVNNSLALSWKTPKDNVGVTGYLLKYGVNLEKSVTLTANQLNYTIDGIAKGNYQYQLIALDAAGNQSKPKSGKATIKMELPQSTATEWPLWQATAQTLDLETPVTSCANDRTLTFEDPLAYCAVLQTESALQLAGAIDSLSHHDDKTTTRSLLASAS